MPFWMLIGGHFLLGERMTARKIAGLLLAFGGLVLVFSDKLSQPGPDALIGDLMSLGAGLAWAATYVVIKRTTLASAGAEKLLLYQLVVAAVVAARRLAVRAARRFATPTRSRPGRCFSRPSISWLSPT